MTFENNPAKRSRKKCTRIKGLIQAAQDFGTITGGRVFMKFVGPVDKRSDRPDAWSFASSDAMYQEYITTGLHPEILERREQNGPSIIFVPKPTSTPTSTPQVPALHTSTPITSTADSGVAGMVKVQLSQNSFVTPSKSAEAQEIDLNFLNLINTPENEETVTTIDMEQFTSFALPLDDAQQTVTQNNNLTPRRLIPDPEIRMSVGTPQSNATATLQNPNSTIQNLSLDGNIPVSPPDSGPNVFTPGSESNQTVQVMDTTTNVSNLDKTEPIPSSSNSIVGYPTQSVSLNAGIPVSLPNSGPNTGIPVSESSQTLPLQDTTANVSNLDNRASKPSSASSIAEYQKNANSLMVKKLIADKMKLKSEKVQSGDQCISCGDKWYKSHPKWKWKSCGLCSVKVHTTCLGWTKEDSKKRLYICGKCNTEDSTIDQPSA